MKDNYVGCLERTTKSIRVENTEQFGTNVWGSIFRFMLGGDTDWKTRNAQAPTSNYGLRFA